MSTLKAGKIQAGISVTPGNNFVLDASADDGTLVLRNSAGTALVTLASGGAADLYAQGNILGTVSQSGGVPTGAIIETGSNANGYYVKFANGLMITAKEVAITTSIASAWGTIYASAPIAIGNLSATFVNKPQRSISCGGANTIMIGFSSDATVSTAGTVYLISGISQTSNTYVIAVVCVGFWF